MKICYYIFLFTFLVNFAQAQIKVECHVIDSVTLLPLPGANIVIRPLSLHDEIFTTDKSGYLIMNLKPGQYDLKIRFIGYNEKILSHLNIEHDTIQIIELKAKINTLKEVNINYKKALIEKNLDRTTVSIANTLFANATSALELIPKMPGVVSFGNSITLQGKEVDVWVDGRPTNVKGPQLQSLLNSLPGNSIEKIELVSNPSSVYDAQSSAIINIVTVKIKQYGLNGSILNNYTQGIFPRNTSGINLNYRQKNINLYGSYFYQYRKEKVTSESDFPATFGNTKSNT
jgi:iron complex outermembrane receptor protein